MKRIEAKFGFLISIILSVIGIWSTLYFSNSDATDFINKIALPIMVFSVAIILSILSYRIYLSRVQIEFYKDRQRTPKIFDPDRMLKYIAKNGYHLSIIGRTNISWFENINERRKHLYKLALNNGCIIEFIIQHDFVRCINLTNKTIIEEIKNDYYEVIKNFETLKNDLSGNDNFRLFLTGKPIENSMTRIFSNDGYIKYFSYDISQNINEKPFIVFRKNSVFEELKNKFDKYKEDAISIEDYKEKTLKANKEVDALVKKFNQYSVQRENDNRKLVNHFFERKESERTKKFVPPVSIQLLITNKCTSRCVMCNHHEIRSSNELSEIELQNILWYINDIGTKNIIISGGEPLSRDYCLDLLTYAKSKLGLNIGLLTNGIKRGGKSITRDDAVRIKETCDWVQISIDSFDPDTYRKIRNVNYAIVAESLRNLANNNVKSEICFTIQKLNIDEAIRIIKGVNIPPTNIPIRFKFAHGPNNQNDFLLTHDINKISTFLQHCHESDKFNLKYLSEMFIGKYFSVKDVANGTPLYLKNRDFNNNGFRCHILNYSCKIDAEGNLYPCCFLFDDNQGKSEIRKIHKLGSLRSGDLLVKLHDSDTNILRELLISNRRIASYRYEKIPVEENACNYCIRHFYQNDFLNNLEKISEKYDNIGFRYRTDEDNSRLWI